MKPLLYKKRHFGSEVLRLQVASDASSEGDSPNESVKKVLKYRDWQRLADRAGEGQFLPAPNGRYGVQLVEAHPEPFGASGRIQAGKMHGDVEEPGEGSELFTSALSVGMADPDAWLPILLAQPRSVIAPIMVINPSLSQMLVRVGVEERRRLRAQAGARN